MRCNEIFLIMFLFFIFAIPNISSEITGESVTGEATAQPIGINITVVVIVPTLTIISPTTGTYLTNESILLNYTSNGDTIKYNLDNSTNTTITSFTYFNTSQGTHTLYLYATSGSTTTEKNITFTVNSTKFTILYDKYKDTNKGSSTELIIYSFEDLQNLSDIILEHTDYGKIKFNQAINLTDDINPTDNTLDIDSYINISSNRIEINSTNLPNFNKSATLSLYNLTFTTPRILKDGAVCSSTICTQQSYSGGTLVFNITGFSVYSAEQTPTSVTPPPSGGGGGSTTKRTFSINKETIKIKLKQGTTKTEKIKIKNTGITKLKFTLESSRLENLLIISEESFELEKGKSKTIDLDFIARENTIPNLYMGKIIVEGGGIKKEILITLEIESKKSLFDVELKIPSKYLYVLPGENLLSNIKLYNLGETGRVDVLLDYVIKDKDGNEIIFEHETIAVETQASLTKEIKIPENAKYGKYILYVKLTYNGQVASASTWFNIGEESFINITTTIIVIVIFIIIFALFVLYELKHLRKHGHKKRYIKIGERAIKKHLK